ncbi:hypothetical protein AB4308_07820, partial [Vibrio breoganii]
MNIKLLIVPFLFSLSNAYASDYDSFLNTIKDMPCSDAINLKFANSALAVYANNKNSSKWARFALNAESRGNQQSDFVKTCNQNPSSSVYEVVDYLVGDDIDEVSKQGDWVLTSPLWQD